MSTTQLSSATPDSSGESTTPVSGVVSETEPNSVYDCLFKPANEIIATMYQGSTTTPCQEHTAAMLIYLVARICHEIAKKPARPSWLTAIIFHGSGMIAFEALFWVIVGQLPLFIIINVFILLVAFFCYHRDICELLSISYQKIFGQEGLTNADQMTRTVDACSGDRN